MLSAMPLCRRRLLFAFREPGLRAVLARALFRRAKTLQSPTTPKSTASQTLIALRLLCPAANARAAFLNELPLHLLTGTAATTRLELRPRQHATRRLLRRAIPFRLRPRATRAASAALSVAVQGALGVAALVHPVLRAQAVVPRAPRLLPRRRPHHAPLLAAAARTKRAISLFFI